MSMDHTQGQKKVNIGHEAKQSENTFLSKSPSCTFAVDHNDLQRINLNDKLSLLNQGKPLIGSSLGPGSGLPYLQDSLKLKALGLSDQPSRRFGTSPSLGVDAQPST